MHLYTITRGIKHDVDRFINDLQAQYFPYKIPKGKMKGEYNVQFSVRPIQLWEFVMPKESLGEAMNMIWDSQEHLVVDRFQKRLMVLRKMLGAKKFPDLNQNLPKRIIYKNNVGVYPIGIKEDNMNEHDAEAL